MTRNIRYSVFSKPWKDVPVTDLARRLSELGFDGVEFPIRPEFQVAPEEISEGLPESARVFADHGIAIESIAGPTDERSVAACAEAGVPMIRICLPIGEDGYLASEARYQREFERLAPTLEEYGVAVGIQNHCNNQIGSCLGVMRLIEDYPPEQFCMVWDPAHNVLAGEIPEQAIDICWSHLRMVNLKSPYWHRTSSPEAYQAQWVKNWTSGRHGITDWPRVVELLLGREWEGPVCLTAEYTTKGELDRLVADDLSYAKMLFGG